MASDLTLLRELEDELGHRLVRVRYKPRQRLLDAVLRSEPRSEDVLDSKDFASFDEERRRRTRVNFAVLDSHNRVVGLQLYKADLKSLPSVLSKFQELQVVTAPDNQIRHIHPDLLGLPRLRCLDLRGNRIRALPRDVFDSPLAVIATRSIRIGEGLLVSANPIESPPLEIISRGKRALDAYFDSLEAPDRSPLNELKIILVGDGAAGKTSLVKQLLGHKFNKNESTTHGIRIRRWKVEQDEAAIYAHLWDFGGQEIMHATHQFFLSRRSLYLLVLDSRKDEKAEYWLKHIQSFGGDSPVLVVLNKCDEHPGFDVNRKILKEKYPSIVGFYQVSCKTTQGIEELSEALLNTITSVEMLRTMWPSSWFRVKKQLEKMTRTRSDRTHYISYEQYTQLCVEAGVTDPESQDVLVEFLNDLGVMLHFKDFELEDTHVLDPKWVTNGVYRIINSKALANQKGVLRFTQLRQVLSKRKASDYSYPRGKYRYIVDLMKKFELCYLLDDTSILVPDLLPVREADFKFDFDAALRYVVEYDFLPRSIMPRLLVNLHHDIKDELAWRTGAVLRARGFGSTAVIRADNDEERIYVYVSGGLERDYLAVVRHTLLAINNSFQHLGTTELVPCCCKECQNQKSLHYFDYNALTNFRKKRRKRVLCPRSADYVQIEQLLSGIEGSDVSTEEEILKLLRELKKQVETKESFLSEANKIIQLKPNLAGFGIDVNALASKWFRTKEKKKSK